jgi:hypothetical protein
MNRRRRSPVAWTAQPGFQYTNNDRVSPGPGHVNLVVEAKRRLPLPDLMKLLGDGEHAKKSARCPFHEDKKPSFSMFKGKDGGWYWKCHAGCGQGDEVNYLGLKLYLSVRDAIRRYRELAGVKGGGA